MRGKFWVMSTTLNELEAQHRRLLFSLRLPDSVLQRDAPAHLKQLDMTFARQLMGANNEAIREDVFAESEQFVREILTASTEGRQLHLASEISLLSQVKESGGDVVHKGPFGLMEAVYPVRVRGFVVHLVQSGKYRTTPFTEKDIKDIAFLTGRPMMKVGNVGATLPVFTTEQVTTMQATLRRLRDVAELALKEHMKARGLSGQQLQGERLTSLGTLAEGMAHHFSNLLSVILGYGSLVLDKAKLDEDSAESLKKITEAAQRGRRFTDEVLALTEAEEEGDTRCALHERLDGVLEVMQPRLPPGARIQREFAAERDVVLAPAGVVHQTVFNMVAASLDGLPRGGTLVVRTSNCAEMGQLGLQDCIKIELVDSGVAVGGHVTSARSALDTLAGESVGPKLTSLFGMIGRLDGVVTVESSEDGRASRVEVVVPLAGESAATAEKKIRRRLEPSNLWIVDDDSNVCEMCTRVLGAEGHSVRALDGGDALVAAMQKASPPPDLLVIDFNLTDQNGLELIGWLRDAGHRTPVIFTTAFGAEHPLVAKALKYRKAFLLKKPFTFRDLADQVTIAMGETLIGT